MATKPPRVGGFVFVIPQACAARIRIRIRIRARAGAEGPPSYRVIGSPFFDWPVSSFDFIRGQDAGNGCFAVCDVPLFRLSLIDHFMGRHVLRVRGGSTAL